MEKNNSYLKDLIYLSIIFVIIIANLLAALIYINNGLSFLSILITIVSFILGIFAVFYTAYSGFKIDSKIDEMHRTMLDFTKDLHHFKTFLDKAEVNMSSIEDICPPEKSEDVTILKSNLERLRSSLSITMEKMLYSDKNR